MTDYVDAEALQDHIKTVVQFPADRVRVPQFKRERFDDVEPASHEWLVKHFLPKGGVGIVYGASTVGKSFLVLYFCLRIALGKDILGHRAKQAGVLYAAAEGAAGMRKRMKAIRTQFGVSAPAFQFLGTPLNLLDEDFAEAFIRECASADGELREEFGFGLGIVVIDTTSASMPGGNENAGEDMSRVLGVGQRIVEATGALVLFVAHPGKNEALGVRGWSGQVGNVDAILYIKEDEEDPTLRVGVVQKLKDGEDGERFAYRLKQIHMGTDADGDAITSAYPVFEEPPITASSKRKRSVEDKPGPALILRALGQMIDAGQGVLVPRLPGVPLNTFGVDRIALRIRAVNLGYADPDEKPDTIKRNVNRDIQALVAAKRLRANENLIWMVSK